ncbi:MAG: hypothetical protein ACN4GW_03645 [Desulforhopalus sp.]
MSHFSPSCLPLLIGSLPHDNHVEAIRLIREYTPELPLWPQLPIFPREGMIPQFAPGMPGLTETDGKLFVDSEKASFEEELLAFYEEYLNVSEGGVGVEDSRFALSREAAEGFYTFLDSVSEDKRHIIGLKGQTTGPVTFCTGLVDQAGRAIFYNDQLRDAAVKHLALKARWQTRKMAEVGSVVIMVFDEPALAGLGSSAFITITHDDILACLGEAFDGVRSEGGLTGVHVCANTEWPVLFESGVDVISYDAYSFFDKLVLYPDHLKNFIAEGRLLATGIVPTTPEYIELESVDSLVEKWFAQTAELQAIGIDEKDIYRQSLITPSCGTGTVSREQALKVLELTRGVSRRIRAAFE